MSTKTFSTRARNAGMGIMAGVVLAGTIGTAAQAAEPWVKEYKNDAPGASTPLSSDLKREGFQGDIDSKTGIAFSNLSGTKIETEYGSLGSFWHKDAKTTLWCIQYAKPFVGVNGNATSNENTENAAITNYIITKYQGDNTPRNHAAIAYAVHQLNDPLTGSWKNADGTTETAKEMLQGVRESKELGDVAKSADNMIADAKANVGPYTATVTADESGKVTSDFKSKAGNSIAGFDVTYTLSDGAVFDANGNGVADQGESNVAHLKTGDKIPNVVSQDKSKDNKVSIKMDVTNAPAPSIRVWDGGPNVQTVMATGSTAAVTANDSFTVKGAQSYTPQVTTQTSNNFATPGSEISDKIKVTGNKDGQKLEVTSTLWYTTDKPTAGDQVPSTAKKVGEVKTEVTGNGEFTTPGVKVDKGGYYTWTESIPETKTPEGGITKAWQGKWGVSTETTVVGKVSTKASDDVTVGDKIHDTAIVEGNVPEGSTVDFTLYKISDKQLTDEEVDKQKDELSKQFTDNNIVWKSDKGVAVDKAGEYNSAEFTTKSGGTYSYVETLKDKDGKVISEGGKPVGKESVVVKPKQETPKKETPAQTPTTTPSKSTPSTPAPTVEKATANTGGFAEDNKADVAGAGALAGILTMLGLGFITRRKGMNN